MVAKELLQGTWMDDMTETPLFKVKGDTIHYFDETIRPTAFKIIKDTLKMLSDLKKIKTRVKKLDL